MNGKLVAAESAEHKQAANLFEQHWRHLKGNLKRTKPYRQSV
jgi:hypothetical protein